MELAEHRNARECCSYFEALYPRYTAFLLDCLFGRRSWDVNGSARNARVVEGSRLVAVVVAVVGREGGRGKLG